MNEIQIDLKEYGELHFTYNNDVVILNKLFHFQNPIQIHLPKRLLHLVSMRSNELNEEFKLTDVINQNDTEIIFRYEIEKKLSYTITFQIEKRLGIIRRFDSLQNLMDQELKLIQYLQKYYFEDGLYEVYDQDSAWCKENIGSWHKLHSLYFESEGARTTQGHTPFIVLKKDQRAVSFHLKPIGDYEINIKKVSLGVGNPNQFVYECKLGMKSEALNLALLPQETLVLPEVLIQSIPTGNLNDSTINFHSYLLKNERFTEHKVIYNTWFDQFDQLDIEQLTQNLTIAKELGCEVFVVDAGWFGSDEYGWWDSIGHYEERKQSAFKGRMKEFSDLCRNLGLEFGLWIEPERISKHAPNYKMYPEYFVYSHGFYYPKLYEQGVFDLIYDQIESLITKYDLKWIKWDFNFELTEDLTFSNFYRYNKALYQLLAELRKNYPEVFLEGCASGGLRNDLNTVSCYDGFFLCDNVNPKDTILMYHHATLRHNPYKIIKWTVLKKIDDNIVTPSGNGAGFDQVEVVKDLDFILAVNMLGMTGFSGNYMRFNHSEINKIQTYIKLYKKYRHLLQQSFVYSNTEPKGSINEYDFLHFQFKHINKDEMLVFSFKLNTKETISTFSLKDVKYGQYELNESEEIDGKRLIEEGLKISFTDDHVKITHLKLK